MLSWADPVLVQAVRQDDLPVPRRLGSDTVRLQHIINKGVATIGLCPLNASPVGTDMEGGGGLPQPR